MHKMNPVVMPVRNGLELTKKAAISCFNQTVDIEMLIIDNGSTDGTREWLWQCGCDGHINSIILPSHTSVSEMWNRGLEWAFRYWNHCLVINNDVELRPDTYERLLKHGGEFVTGVGVREWPTHQKTNSLDAMKTPEGKEALDKVKISHFLRKGHNITGIVHVGANNGYEVQWYRKLGISPILCFEPCPAPIQLFSQQYSEYEDVKLVPIALGDKNERSELRIAPGDGQGSSLLIDPKASWNENKIGVDVQRFDNLIGAEKVKRYNCLVVDTQGMELQVLKGFGKLLDQFDYLNIECSEVPLYEGEAPASEVIEYLKERGFDQDTPTEPHNDIMFIRHRELRESPHPDFSCFLIRKSAYERVGPFDENFRGAYAEDLDYHVRLHRAGVRAVSIDVPFLHHAAGTLKSSSRTEQAKIQQNAEKNRAYFKKKWGATAATEEYDRLFDDAHFGVDSKVAPMTQPHQVQDVVV